jgi:predicted 2-oxoglutarate/Fe(II)-dependent dioxygenase YbiX
MEFTYVADGIDAVIIDNFYTEEQLKEIMIELKWLTKTSIMADESKLKPAEDEHGEILTSKNGIFLEEVFKNWQHSALISHGMKQMVQEEFKSKLLEYNTMFKSVFECNTRCHLVSYYENSQYYKPHRDAFFFTILNYFFTEPKQFEGGELVLYSCNSDKEATIEPKHNRTVVILSSTTHQAKEIKSKLDQKLSGHGRYCNAIFLSTTDPRKK